MSKPKGNESTQKRRKPRSSQKSLPAVTFESAAENHYIPYEEGRSPVSTRISSCSSPRGMKFMDEIALLKRGQIDKDAPKHPYNRRAQQFEPELPDASLQIPPSILSTSRESLEQSLLNETAVEKKITKLGMDGQLKHSKTKSGGDVYELSAEGYNKFALFHQGNGQTSLFLFAK